jgi:hypothetical protein
MIAAELRNTLAAMTPKHRYAGEIARHAVSGQSSPELAEERGGQA